VIIQVIMVGLIIAFPGLVSGGLTKEATIDADKVFQQMQNDAKEPKAEPKQDPSTPEAGAGATAPTSGAAPVADEKEDPMKAMMESLKNEQAKKP
jgi:hypothetical protein